MKFRIHSYRFAQEILQHPKHKAAWAEIEAIIKNAPLFVYPGKSEKKPSLDVVQQVMNTYFDRQFSVDSDWQYHPLATNIPESGLSADFRKDFAGLVVQAEVQFGNMSRWYSDIFKFQTAYSQSLIKVGLSIVPMNSLAVRIDSNIVNYERTLRELPSAELSITLPILLVGVEIDSSTHIVDLRECKFRSVKEITGKGKEMNRWRIVHAYLSGHPMSAVDPNSDTGPTLSGSDDADND